MKISELATALHMEFARDGEFVNFGYANQQTPGLFTYLESVKYLSGLENGCITSVVTTKELSAMIPENIGIIIHAEPKQAFFKIHDYLWRHTDFYGVRQKTIIPAKSNIGKNACIAEYDVVIGKNVVIEDNVVIREGVEIGDNVIIRSGSIIGGEGFEFKRIKNVLVRIPHAGRVKIRENVEIQHGVMIDRAVFSSATIVGAGSKIDNLVHIAHNVVIGDNVLIAAGAVIAGSSKVEDDVWIGPGSVISNSILIGEGAFVTLGSVVVKNVPSHSRAYGKTLGCVIVKNET